MAEETVKKQRSPRIPDTAVIRMGKNDEGVSYGGSLNPKRAGSLAHGRFGAYKEGCTVADAKAAGLTAADITYDRDHGYIAIDLPPAAEKPAKAPRAKKTEDAKQAA
jgi:hypothetical protein